MKNAFKKIMAMALVIAVIVGVLPSVFAANVAGFTDVQDDAWYAKYVEYVAFQDLMTGTSPTTFEPDSGLTRAMTATVLWRMAGEPPVYNKSTFTDLKEDWYMNAVAWAQANDVVNGTSATTFEPDTFATREQIVAMLWRYSGSPKVETDYLKDYTDASRISGYARDAFNWAISVGIISGYKNQLTPRDNATRAEFAKMIYQYAELNKPCSHEWDEGTVTKEPTCTEAGEKLLTCTKCGLTKTEPIPAKGHHYGDDGKCTDCGAEKPVDPTEPTTPTEPEPTDDEYVLTNELKGGEEVVIYNPGNGVAVPAVAQGNYYLNVTAVTPVDNKITTSDSTIVWKVTKNDDGSFTFVSGDKTLSLNWNTESSKTSVTLDGANPNIALTSLNSENYTYTIYSATQKGKYEHIYLEYYSTEKFTEFSAYDTSSDRATEKNFGFQFYVKGGDTPTPPTPPTPATDEYVLTNELKGGEEVVIYNAGNGFAVPATAKGSYYLGLVEIAPVDNKITTDDSTIIWKVTKNDDGTFTFVNGDKTLSINWNADNSKTSVTLDGANPKMTLESLNDETHAYAIYSATQKGKYEHIYLEYFGQYTEFSAYDTSSDRATEKNFGFQFYVKGGETPEPGCEHVWGEGVETTPATCTEAGVKTYTCSKCGETKTETIPALGHDYVNGVCSRCGAEQPTADVYVKTTTLKEGDEIIIVCDSKNIALSSEKVNTNYNKGVAVTPVDNKITTDDKTIVWTVGKDGEFYTFSQDGHKISMGTQYTSMPMDDVNYKWQVTAAATEGAFYIANLGRGESETDAAKKVYYMQWYADRSQWSAYHTLNEELMALSIYAKGAEAPHEHTWNDGVVTTEPTCTAEGVKTYTCSGCGLTKTEAIPALGHDYVNGVCSRCGAAAPVLTEYVLATALKDGDEVVIVNAEAKKAMSEDAVATKYRAGVDVVPENDTVKTDNSKIVWTVAVVDGGYQFKNDAGETLSATSGLSFADTDNVWALEAGTVEKTFIISSTTAKGSSGDPKSIEWYAQYNEFSTFYKKASNESLFAMNFYVKKTEEEPAKDITVYFTNDVHGEYELYPYAATAMKGADLLVDAGDNIQGSVATTLTNGQCMVDLMKTVGYDVAVPGNHEFDYGFDRFLEIVNGDNTPYISANLWDKTADKAVLDAYKIIEVNGKKIAIVGITTPETLVKSTPAYFQNEQGEYIYDFCNDSTGEKLYTVVQKAVDAAKAEGADYVIAVGHLGIDEQSEPWTSTTVIANTNGIDALIDGHSHSTFSNTQKNKDGKDVVVAQTGTKLANVGKLTIAADGTITAVNVPLYEVKTRVNPDSGKEEKYNDYLFEADEKIAEAVAKVKEEVDKVSNTVVAKTEVDLTTLDPVTGKRAVRSAETNLGDLCADAYRDLLGTDVAFVNGGGVRADIKKGDITYGDIIAVHPFGNTACKIEVTGEQIWTALEIGAAANPGESGGFLQVSGIEYTINTYIPTPARFNENKEFVKLEGEHRVTDVKIGGQPLDVNKTYALGGHNYMLINGGDGYTVFKGCKILAQEVAIDNEVLIKYITGTLKGVVAADSAYANPTGAGRITIVTEKPEEPDTHTHTYGAPKDATYTWDDIHTTCTATTLCADENCPDPEKGKITETCNDVTKKVIFRWNCLEDELSDVTATFKDTEHFLPTVKLEKAVTKKATATEHTWDENDECTVCHIFAGLNSKQLALLHPASGMLLLDQTYTYADGKKTGLQGAEYAIEDGVVNTLEKEDFKFRIYCGSHYTQPYELVIARGTFYCDGENLTVKEVADIEESLRQNIFFDIETNEDGTKYISFTNVTNKDGKKVYLMWDGEAFTVAPMDETNKAAYTFKLAVGGHAHQRVNPTVTTPATCTTDGVMTYECESKVSGCNKTWEETIPATGHDVDTTTGICKTCGKTVYALAESVGAGDEVIIYHVNAAKALSTDNFAGADVTIVKDTITTEDAVVWKVEKDVNGLKFVNKATGETLATDSSRALKYAETDNYWTLKWSKDFKSRIIVSTTAKGGQGDPQAIEWFKGSFTTYYWKTTSTESDFAVRFYAKNIKAAADHTHEYSDVTTRWADDYSAFYFEYHCTAIGCGDGAEATITGTGITETVVKEATCTAEGKVQYSVTYNAHGTILTATSPEVTIDALGHDYDSTTHLCTRCGEAEPLTPPASSTRYEKVTTAPTDWSGTYLIVYEKSDTEGYVFNGVDSANNKVDVTITSSTISTSEAVKACEITVASCDSGYSFQLTGGTNATKYLAAVEKKNTIDFSSTAKALTITLQDSTVAIKDGDVPFQFNSGNLWFRFFGKKNGGQSAITLYKLVTE